MPLQADSGPKTASCSPWGKYCFTRMPFGLMNAPATFQRCMDEALTDQYENTGTYIDDVLVYSRTWEEHLHHIEETLKALRRAGLTAKPDKCVWGARSLSYLGHDVGEGLVRVPDARVRLRDFARPRTKKDLRAFLGTNRRFIPDFAGRAGPLFNALKKGAPTSLVWDNIMTSSFTYLISTLCSSNTLWLPREDDHFTLHTDASLQGLGAVLSVIRDGEEQPIAYFSKRLLPAEENYSASELECLAVVKAIDHFAIHLLGKPFTIVINHRALAALQTSNKLTGG